MCYRQDLTKATTVIMDIMDIMITIKINKKDQFGKDHSTELLTKDGESEGLIIITTNISS